MVLNETDLFVVIIVKLAVVPERFQVFLSGRRSSHIVHVGFERGNLVAEGENDDRDHVTEENHNLKERPIVISLEGLRTVINCLMVYSVRIKVISVHDGFFLKLDE